MSSVSICKIFKSVIEKTLNIIKKYQFTLKKSFTFAPKRFFQELKIPLKREKTPKCSNIPQKCKSQPAPQIGGQKSFSASGTGGLPYYRPLAGNHGEMQSVPSCSMSLLPMLLAQMFLWAPRLVEMSQGLSLILTIVVVVPLRKLMG